MQGDSTKDFEVLIKGSYYSDLHGVHGIHNAKQKECDVIQDNMTEGYSHIYTTKIGLRFCYSSLQKGVISQFLREWKTIEYLRCFVVELCAVTAPGAPLHEIFSYSPSDSSAAHVLFHYHGKQGKISFVVNWLPGSCVVAVKPDIFQGKSKLNKLASELRVGAFLNTVHRSATPLIHIDRMRYTSNPSLLAEAKSLRTSVQEQVLFSPGDIIVHQPLPLCVTLVFKVGTQWQTIAHAQVL